jgi:hypothetical protein
MAMTKDQILAEARFLGAQEREELIEDLRQADAELSNEQLEELRRRIAALDRGETKLLPGEQVIQELMSELRRR